MFLKVILGIIALVSGFIATKGFFAVSALQQIYYAFNALIFVVCVGFINTPHKVEVKSPKVPTREEIEQKLEKKRNAQILVGGRSR